jgi:hypothetical protein
MKAFFRWLEKNGMPDMPLEWDSTRQMIITTRDVDVCA